MLKLILRASIVAMDMGETHTAYLLLIKALGMATKQGKPTAHILASMNHLRLAHGRKPFFAWA